HVDAPLHFIEGGPAAETLPLDVLVGPAVVVDATSAQGEIGADIELPAAADRLLFKTQNSELWEHDRFIEQFVRVGLPLAGPLVAQDLDLPDPGQHRQDAGGARGTDDPVVRAPEPGRRPGGGRAGRALPRPRGSALARALVLAAARLGRAARAALRDARDPR